MKKLLIASTALVATAGMASADITISGHAAAGIYSGLGNADAVTVAAELQLQLYTRQCRVAGTAKLQHLQKHSQVTAYTATQALTSQ